MTKGKHWTRKDRLWTDEVDAWIRERCPLREHGYRRRQELLDELNAVFGRSFSMSSFCTHCYDSGIQLGLGHSNSGVPRGEKHWRHRSVGSLQQKKGYVRIKVAEPNRWMQYQRYVWEQHHPGESAAGMTVIFLDGNNRNFDPSNLERVTRAELAVMAALGHTADMTREERELLLLRARIAIARGKLAGRKRAGAVKRRAYYEKRRLDPAYKAWRAEYAKRHQAEIMADPVRHAEALEKQRAYRAANRERCNAWAREYWRRRRGRREQ